MWQDYFQRSRHSIWRHRHTSGETLLSRLCGAALAPHWCDCLILFIRSFQTSRSFTATCWGCWETWPRSERWGHSCSRHSSSQCSGERSSPASQYYINTLAESLQNPLQYFVEEKRFWRFNTPVKKFQTKFWLHLFSMCSPPTPCCDSNLLDSKADGIEVSYNACGVLSHIMFDGPEVWLVEELRRDTVMDKMWNAIQSWDVSSQRNINYRSVNCLYSHSQYIFITVFVRMLSMCALYWSNCFPLVVLLRRDRGSPAKLRISRENSSNSFDLFQTFTD